MTETEALRAVYQRLDNIDKQLAEAKEDHRTSNANFTALLERIVRVEVSSGRVPELQTEAQHNTVRTAVESALRRQEQTLASNMRSTLIGGFTIAGIVAGIVSAAVPWLAQ